MFDIRKIQEHALFTAVKKVSGEKTAHLIVHGKDNLQENDADWVKNSMQRLELNFDTDTVKDIRMNCQCGYAMDEKLELVQNLFSSANNLDEFANCETAQKAGLYAKDGELYLSFAFCPCPMLAGVDRLPAVTWCYCTTGYSKVLFEKVFGCEVKVVLLKSIKTGDENCLMKIHPLSVLWQK